MVLLNPCHTYHDTSEHKVAFPVQNKEALLRVASTFMEGGRTIDLVLVSESLEGVCNMVTHNGMHCVQCGCDKGWCWEISRSDHFFNELTNMRERVDAHEGPVMFSRPRMPKGFTDKESWKTNLQPLLPLAALLGQYLAPNGEDWRCRSMARNRRQREADLVASSVEMFFLLAMVLWCARPDVGLPARPTERTPITPEEWQRKWILRASASETRSDALTNLCRAARPVTPHPPDCMSSQVGRLSVEQSHGAWRKRILDEKQWT